MLQYLFIVVVVTMVIVFVVIKIKYPFWNLQPVFHTYDLWRYFYRTPFYIYKYRPIKTKWCDFAHISTEPFTECSPTLKKDLVNLLQCFFIPSDRILHLITLSDLENIMSGYNEPVYVSVFMEEELTLTEESTLPLPLPSPLPSPLSLALVPKQVVKACVFSKPVTLFYRPTLVEPEFTEEPLYYLDLLTVTTRKNEEKRQKVTRNLIQTHEYNQRTLNPEIRATLLRKEVTLFDGVIPFIRFKTSTYHIRNIRFPALPSGTRLLKMTTENLDLLYDFLTMIKGSGTGPGQSMFDAIIVPDLGALLVQIKSGLLHVFCLCIGEHTLAIYFFRDNLLLYEDLLEQGNTIHCFATVSNTENDEAFYLGFLHSIQMINQAPKKYTMILFDEIGHTNRLLEEWRQRNSPLFINQAAYYLYNLVVPCSPFNSVKTLFIV